MSTVTIKGGCHCKAMRYELHWPVDAEKGAMVNIPGRRCSCSFCTRIGGVWTSHPQARLNIVEDANHPVTSYRFGTKTADFLFCSNCGIAPVVTCELQGRLYAVVNVNTFDRPSDKPDEGPWEIEPGDTCFDGESTEDRLDRRQARWISQVIRNRR